MAPEPETALPDELVSGLARLEKHVRSLLYIRGTGLILMIVGAGLAVGLSLDLAFSLPSSLRSVVLIAVAGLTTLAVIWNWVRPACRRLRAAELAALVEDAHPEFGERLTSAIELNDPTLPSAHRGSELMCEQLTRQAAASAETIDLTTAVTPSKALRYFTIGAACLLLLILPFLVAPQWYVLLWSRLLVPWGNFDSAGNLVFEVENGDRVVARGDDVTIRVRPRWRMGGGELPGPVWLTRTGSDGEQDARRLEADSESGTLAVTVPHVFSPFDYHVECGRLHSRRYEVAVVDAPETVAFSLQVEPPAYTGRAVEKHDGALGEIVVFENSKLHFQLGFNKPVSSAQLGVGRELSIADDGLSATFEETASAGGPIAVRLTDEFGLQNRNDPDRSIRVVADASPTLTLSGSDEPASVRPGEACRFTVAATDDIAVENLELHYQVFNGDCGTIAVEPSRLGGASVEHEFELSTEALKLLAGQTLTYQIRAADGRPVPGPNEVWSNRRVLSVNSDAPPPGAGDVAQRQQDLKQRLAAIRSELVKHREQVAQLHNESVTANENKAEFTGNDKIRALPQQELAAAQKLESLADDLSAQPLFEKLGEPTRQVARNELAESSKELTKAAGAPLPDQSSALKESVDRLLAADHKLGEIERKFDQLAGLEKDLLELDRLAREAEQLADSAQAIHDDRQNAAAEPPRESEGKNSDEQSVRQQKTAKDEEQLRKDQQALSEELKSLLDRQPELVNAARQEQLDRLAELGKQALALAKPQEMMAEDLREEPNSDSKEKLESEQQEAEQLQSRQQQAAQLAAKLAIQTAGKTGPQSEASQKALEAMRQGTAAAQSLLAGRLGEAGRQALAAAKSANEAAESLETTDKDRRQGENSQPNESLARQARETAAGQEQVARQIEEASKSPAKRTDAQIAGERQLSEATRRLTKELENVASRLSVEPLTLPESAAAAKGACQCTGSAEGEMQQTGKSLQAGQSSSAAETAERAATELKEAAARAAGGVPQEQGEPSPVPGEIADRVADAAQQLDQAGQQLSQAGSQQKAANESEKDGEGSKTAEQGQSQEKSQGQGEGKEGRASQEALAQSSQQLRRAAEALAKAAENLKSGNSPEAGRGAPSAQASLAGDGSGTQVTLDPKELEVALSRMEMRQWGQLPGTLQTEILQAAGRKPNSNYAKLIRLYFREIADERQTRENSQPDRNKNDRPAP